MIKWQNGFFVDSKAAGFDWAEALSNPANAAVAKKPPVPRDALLLEVRRVPSAGMYLDTIRQTRLALLPK
jgi:hypothetical protein